MIWKLYKITALILLRCCLLACYWGDASQLVKEQLAIINSINCIIQGIQTYKALHPKFAEQQFGSLDQFLQERLVRADWLVWLQLRTAVSTEPFKSVDQPIKIA